MVLAEQSIIRMRKSTGMLRIIVISFLSEYSIINWIFELVLYVSDIVMP